MSRIDNYLESMERFKASGLILSSGANVVLKFPAGDRAATQSTSHEQVREIVREIAPTGSLAAIERGAVSTFFYRGANSSFEVSVSPKGDSWIVSIEPSDEASLPMGSSPDIGLGTGYQASGSGLSNSGSSSIGIGTPVVTPAPKSSSGLGGSSTGTSGLVGAGLGAPGLGAPKFTPAPKPDPDLPPNSAMDSVATTRESNSVSVERNAADWVDQILRKMMVSGSSDVHLSSGSEPYWRIDGNIERIPGEASMDADFLENQIRSISPEENWEDFLACNDTDFAYEVKGLSRFRVNVFRDRKGVGTVMRTIPFEIPSAENLGLPKAILDMANLSKGLVLVTGPTGSGKSTTLAALVDHINRTRKDHLITIEDPIEFVHPNKMCLVNQREIRRHTNSFKAALRAALREDPDIVLVGEMRDLETIEIAVETAETGHLVFGTLHTTTAPSTVDRIIDQFPTDRQEQIRQMLSSSLKGVISQVLCRQKGGGRVAAHEILVGTSAVSNLIREAKTFQLFSLMQTGKKLGMVKMEDSLLKLIQEDKVEPMEAYRKANNKQEFANMLQRAGIEIETES